MAEFGVSPATVLVADDDPLIRTVLRMALESMGHEVLEASSADEVVQFSPNREVQLVILDVNMPGADVTACLDALRSHHSRPRVMLLSGESSPALQSRADGFAQKPLDLDSFTGRVTDLLRMP
jgi:two-component system, OmpR family, response regulator